MPLSQFVARLAAAPGASVAAPRLWAAASALALASMLAALSAPAPALADTFHHAVRVPVHAVDANGKAIPYQSQQIGDRWIDVLGATGSVSLARRRFWVGPGGRLFVETKLPESLAGAPHDVDVYVFANGTWQLRQTVHYDPAGKPLRRNLDEDELDAAIEGRNSERPAPRLKSRLVSASMVLPDLRPGPVLVEMHVRGVHTSDWQEIQTGPVFVPSGATLRYGFALDGVDPDAPRPVEVRVEARPTDGGSPVSLLERRIAPSGADPSWFSVESDLGKLAGRQVRLVFRSKPGTDADGPAPGVVWGAPSVEHDEAREAFPAIVLVSLDSLRADALGIYGGPADATPFLDRYFGSDGAVFENAVTQAVTTLPSHMTLMTSLNPCVHGVTGIDRSLGAGVPTLAELLQRAGYRTAAFTEGGALAGPFGFDRGFDVYDEDSSSALDRARKWLADQSGQPLFVFVHSYVTRPLGYGVGGGGVAAARRAYAGAVHTADAQVRALFDTLDTMTVRDRSLVVVTSGNGEEFFEHGAGGHGTHLYREAVRVPLLVRGAGIRGGRRYRQPVGLIDVAPTILELAHVAPPAAMQGKSLARGLGEGEEARMPYRFTEAHRSRRLLRDGSLVSWGGPAYAVRQGSHAVIWSGRRAEAYDVATDPEQVRDLMSAGAPPDWANRLAVAVRNYPDVCRRIARIPGFPPRLSPADRDRLAALGYAEPAN